MNKNNDGKGCLSLGYRLKWRLIRFWRHDIPEMLLPVCALLIIIVGAGIPIVLQTPSSFRVSSVGLQTLGLVVALLGIRDLRCMFNRPTLLSRFRTWCAGIFCWPQNSTLRIHSSTHGMSAGDTLRLTRWLEGGQTLASGLAALESNFKELQQQISDLEGSTRKSIAAVENKLSDEKHRRESEVRALSTKLEAGFTDGLDLATIGVILAITGTILGIWG